MLATTLSTVFYPSLPDGPCIAIDGTGIVDIWQEPIHPLFPWKYVATTTTQKAAFNLHFNLYRAAFPCGFDPNQYIPVDVPSVLLLH